MSFFASNSPFSKFFSYDNEPHWLNVFIHTGFGAAILLGIAAVIAAYLM